MKPSAIHPVVSINSIYRYFTADHISDCNERIIEIITYYYDVSHTSAHPPWTKMTLELFVAIPFIP